MRKIILLSSTLLVAPFVFGEIGEASAQCTTTPSCSSLGYTNGANTGNCIKCPTGNGWFCPPKSDCSCSGFTLTKEQATAQCKGGYQSCKNCSGTVLWKCIGNNEDICISNCSGYTLTYSQALSECGSGNHEACLDKCDNKYLYKCISGGGDSGSSGGSCTCPSGYGTYRYSECSGTTTSSCGSTCYETAVSHPIEQKTCTNVYCNSGKNTLYGTCVYQSRSSYKDSWQTTKTVNDDNVGSALTYNCDKLLGKFTFVLKSETTCGPY